MVDAGRGHCIGCIAFGGGAGATPETDPASRRGRCSLRPELGEIQGTFDACERLHLKRSFKHSGWVAGKAAKRGRARSSYREDEEVVILEPRATLGKPTLGDTEGEFDMDRDGLKQVLRGLLEEESLYGYSEMAKKFQGGTIVIKPSDDALQPKEIPVETFFHKIVMVRDRLRVLEAKLNANDKLSASEKAELQQYVSKVYGTLTTFNVLFKDKADHFSSK